MTNVVLAGGGTAGHTSPLIATADALRAAEPDIAITCIGTARGIETTVVPAAGYDLELIPAVPLPRRLTPALASVPKSMVTAVRAASRIIGNARADVLVGFGGYVCPPGYLAAWRRKLPIVVHEANAVPGIANRFAARWCTEHVVTSFPGTPLPHATCLGLPLRGALRDADLAALRPQAYEFFGLRAGVPTVFVTGGSQGARRLNQAFLGAAPRLSAAGVQVLHAVGMGMANDIAAPAIDGARYRVHGYIDRMELAYAAADLVVCRAGAATVTEVAGLGRPAVYVPLPHGNGEQAANARSVVAAGGGLLIDDDALTAGWVSRELPALLAAADRLARMGSAARGVVRTDAADRLAALVLEVARVGR